MKNKKSLEEFREKIGRPDGYSDEQAEFICDLIASHSLSVASLIEKYDLPPIETIHLWLTKHKFFMSKYILAKRMQAILMTDNILDISNCKTYVDQHGVERADSGMVQIAKMKVEHLKWRAERLAPKVFATKDVDDKVDAIHAEVMRQRKERDKENEKDY